MTFQFLQSVNALKRATMVFVFCMLLSAAPFAQAAFVTSLSDTQIQEVLDNYFPVSEYAAFARVSLHKPQVQLQKNNKRILLMVPVVANISGGDVKRGHATIQVDLIYKPPTGGLYFGNSKVLQFEVPGVDEKMQADLQEIVDSMGKNSLPIVRIYAVKERELNHSLSKSALKSSVIEEGRLRLEFGFK